MDKIKLNEDQLVQLTQYIESRGFKQPFVIMEILDHFACKVEERMEKDPKLSFEQAMVKAHDDFGVRGFAPVVAAYTAVLTKKYSKLYKEERKRTLTSIPSILVILGIGYAYFKSYSWAEVNGYRHLFDINDILVLTYVGFMLSIVFIKSISPYSKEINPIKQAVLSRDILLPFLGIVIVPQLFNTVLGVGHSASPIGIVISGMLGALLLMYAIVRQMTLYRVMKYAIVESDEMSEGYRQLTS